MPPIRLPRRLRLACLLAALAAPLAPAFAAGAEAAACAPVEAAAVPIRYVGTGLVPAIDGAINGAPATMLVDTGSYLTQLTMNGALRHRLALSTTNREVRGIGGSARIQVAQVNDFALGPARTSRRLVLDVIAQTSVTEVFDAIVGAPFLMQMDLEIDLGAKRMRFLQARDCTAAAPAWPEATAVLPFTSSPERNPNPHFTVIVNGSKMDAIIDSGAHDTLLTKDAARRAGIDVDAPGAGVERLGEVGGIGSERAPVWHARFKSVSIGSETIADADLGIVDARADIGVDLLLGQDFLRSHRVLFATSQRKLYIAYLGGDSFHHGAGLEAWMRREADGGNPDAQYVLALRYRSGRGVARDAVQARAWLDKAAAGGEPHAGMEVGLRLVRAGQLDDGIRAMRAALDLMPADRLGPLWLYLARVRNGVPKLGERELEESLAQQGEDDWPRPIADFYLGQLDAAHLLAAAREPQTARARTCQANTYMAEWQRAHGDTARADTLAATIKTTCTRP